MIFKSFYAIFVPFIIMLTNAHIKNIQYESSTSDSKAIFCFFLYQSQHNFSTYFDHPLPCSHIVYAFASLDIESDINIDSADTFKSYQRIHHEINAIKDKNPNTKVLIAIGGWDEGSEKFSALAESKTLSEKFSKNLLKFLIFYGFDGIDLHWMYPTKRGGISEDTSNFLALIKLLKEKLSKRKKLVVAAFGAKYRHITEIYANHVGEFCSTLDFALLLSFDFNEKLKTSFGAILYGNSNNSVLESVQEFIKHGCAREKIILGISNYGKEFRLKSSYKNGVGATANRLRDVEYKRICKALKFDSSLEINQNQLPVSENVAQTTKWTVSKNSKHEKYAYSNKQWISFEDHEDVEAKAKYVNSQNLAGMMFFTLNADDSEGLCGFHFPLLTAASKIIIT